MKKAYSKPALYAEAFALVEHISACAHLNSATSGDPATCAFYLNGPGTTPAIFVSAENQCTDFYSETDFQGVGETGPTGYCYNMFLDEGTLLMHS